MLEQSQYNIMVSGQGGERIVLNTLYGSLAVLDSAGLAALESGRGPLAEKLADNGFLVEDAQRDEDMQRRCFEQDRYDKSHFCLELAPTLACNFDCPYCYEEGRERTAPMGGKLIEAICTFAERMWERDRYTHFLVEWYGGEPLLAPAVIEKLSARFMEFCEKHGIEYSATLLSNTSLATPETARMLRRCKVTSCLTTVDGVGDQHSRRRRYRDGRPDSFDAVAAGIDNLVAAGIEVNVSVNADRNNRDAVKELRKRYADNSGVRVTPNQLHDYYGHFGEGDFNSGEYDLFPRDEYARFVYDLAAESGFTKEGMASMFRPVRSYCRKQREGYYVIDSAGYVNKCDGDMGNRTSALFNVLGDYDVDELATTDYDPFDDPECKGCPLVPLCKGYCAWVRRTCGTCHVLKTTAPDYIRSYRALFGPAISPVEVLVPATSPASVLGKESPAKRSSDLSGVTSRTADEVR